MFSEYVSETCDLDKEGVDSILIIEESANVEIQTARYRIGND